MYFLRYASILHCQTSCSASWLPILVVHSSHDRRCTKGKGSSTGHCMLLAFLTLTYKKVCHLVFHGLGNLGFCRYPLLWFHGDGRYSRPSWLAVGEVVLSLALQISAKHADRPQILIMQGIITCSVAAISYFVMIGFPDDKHIGWHFLNKLEIAFVLARINADRGDARESEPFNLKR